MLSASWCIADMSAKIQICFTFVRPILGYSALFCWRFCKSSLSYEYTCIYNCQGYLKQNVLDVNLSNYCKFIFLTASLFKKNTLNCQYSDVRKTFSFKFLYMRLYSDMKKTINCLNPCTFKTQRRCLNKMKKRWNARLETGRWVFGSARKQRLFWFHFWRRNLRYLFVFGSWYCQIQTTWLIMFFANFKR